MYRVPLLLEKSAAVIHRLDPAGVQRLEPYTGATTGYDKDFREPVAFDDMESKRDEGRVELPEIRVPCQVEIVAADQLNQEVQGNNARSNIRLVFWRGDLEDMGLIDRQTRQLAINVNDRVSAIEALRVPGVTTMALPAPGLFIVEIAPGSFGFGPDGFDLHIVYLEDRTKVA